MSSFDLGKDLQNRLTEGLYRSRKVLMSAQGPEVYMEGRRYLAFCSNDYLGLANHPELIKVMEQSLQTYGVGGGASHLIVGHSKPHHELEQELAEFTGREKALLFSNGYMANIGIITALLGNQDAVFQDRLNHASLLDAGLLSGARFQRYLHCDSESLDKKLEKTDARRKLIVTDGVFSMDGNIAPLRVLSDTAAKHRAWLMADDAHGFGVLGINGGGSAEHFKLSQEQVPVLMGTLGKAFGAYGAFVAGSRELIETLIQYSRTYIYTTSIPPSLAETARASLQLIKDENWRREHLKALIAYFRRGCEQLNIPLMVSETPIQPLLTGTSESAVMMSNALAEKGILVTAIRPPTVPEGKARLRITLSAAHSRKHVDCLLEALQDVMGSTNKTPVSCSAA